MRRRPRTEAGAWHLAPGGRFLGPAPANHRGSWELLGGAAPWQGLGPRPRPPWATAVPRGSACLRAAARGPPGPRRQNKLSGTGGLSREAPHRSQRGCRRAWGPGLSPVAPTCPSVPQVLLQPLAPVLVGQGRVEPRLRDGLREGELDGAPVEVGSLPRASAGPHPAHGSPTSGLLLSWSWGALLPPRPHVQLPLMALGPAPSQTCPLPYPSDMPVLPLGTGTVSSHAICPQRGPTGGDTGQVGIGAWEGHLAYCCSPVCRPQQHSSGGPSASPPPSPSGCLYWCRLLRPRLAARASCFPS